MHQRSRGVYGFLRRPAVYAAFHRLVGADRFRRRLVAEHLALRPGHRLLDVGCGPGDLLAYLPDEVEYHGYDAEPAYVERARQRFGSRGTFHCRRVSATEGDELGRFDRVVASGILHHLDDADADRLFRDAARWLAPGGRLVSVDGAFVAGQPWLARWLLERDRGCHVRTPEGYRRLAEPHFAGIDVAVRQDLARLPLTHAVLTCYEPLGGPSSG